MLNEHNNLFKESIVGVLMADGDEDAVDYATDIRDGARQFRERLNTYVEERVVEEYGKVFDRLEKRADRLDGKPIEFGDFIYFGRCPDGSLQHSDGLVYTHNSGGITNGIIEFAEAYCRTGMALERGAEFAALDFNAAIEKREAESSEK